MLDKAMPDMNIGVSLGALLHGLCSAAQPIRDDSRIKSEFGIRYILPFPLAALDPVAAGRLDVCMARVARSSA